MRRLPDGTLLPYYDRAEIDNGALDGQHLEICWIKDPIDLMFIQIQGSARVRLEDGTMLRINYDAHNGYPYTAVGRVLIEHKEVPREEMSMERIRDWMNAHPDRAQELRDQNRSYVFFRIVGLSDEHEATGAQGVALTPRRSIAVDKALHVYGTPFYIEAGLPANEERRSGPFHRLVIAQDTGSAIVGPARADIYFGAGDEAGKVAGRLRHPGMFTLLIPRALDPSVAGAAMPLPTPRPVIVAKAPGKPAKGVREPAVKPRPARWSRPRWHA
jgi:membrane-bound lytic murein transglycosylase A